MQLNCASGLTPRLTWNCSFCNPCNVFFATFVLIITINFWHFRDSAIVLKQSWGFNQNPKMAVNIIISFWKKKFRAKHNLISYMCLIHWERYSATNKPFQDIGVMDSETVCGNRCWLLLLSNITTTLLHRSLLQSTLFCNNGFCSSCSQFAITVPGRAALVDIIRAIILVIVTFLGFYNHLAKASQG